jgi:hypothetical protein
MWQPDAEVMMVLTEYDKMANRILLRDDPRFDKMAKLQREMWKVLPKAREMMKMLVGEEGWAQICASDYKRVMCIKNVRVWLPYTIRADIVNVGVVISCVQLRNAEAARELGVFLSLVWFVYDDDLFYETLQWKRKMSRGWCNWAATRCSDYHEFPTYFWKRLGRARSGAFLAERVFNHGHDDLQRVVLGFLL